MDFPLEGGTILHAQYVLLECSMFLFRIQHVAHTQDAIFDVASRIGLCEDAQVATNSLTAPLSIL